MLGCVVCVSDWITHKTNTSCESYNLSIKIQTFPIFKKGIQKRPDTAVVKEERQILRWIKGVSPEAKSLQVTRWIMFGMFPTLILHVSEIFKISKSAASPTSFPCSLCGWCLHVLSPSSCCCMTVFQRPSGSLALKETNSMQCDISIAACLKKKQEKQYFVHFTQTSQEYHCVRNMHWYCKQVTALSCHWQNRGELTCASMLFVFTVNFLHTCIGHCKNIIGKETCCLLPNKWNMLFWEFMLFCRNTSDSFFFSKQ